MKNFVKNIVLLGLVLLFAVTAKSQVAVTPFDITYCTTTFPTAYQTVSFSIYETDVKDIKKGQSDNMILTLPTGFEFNTSAGTVTFVNGRDISDITILSLTTTALEIQVVTPSQGGDDALDEIDFNNFQIRATQVTTGSLLRTGGSLTLYRNSTAEPTVALGTMASESPMTWDNSSTVSQDQLSTVDVTQGGVKQEMLRISMVTSDACTPLVVERFIFNTDGGNGTGTDNPSVNISRAQVWYSGTSSSFADATTLFGAYTSPNGEFKINGAPNVSLVEGTNYFWLTYDIPINANNGELADARMDSVLVGGDLKTTEGVDFVEMNPAGSRTIVAPTNFYSIGSGKWTSTNIWSADGTTSCNCTPSATSHAYIDNSVDIDVAAVTIQSIFVRSGGVLSATKNNGALNATGTVYTEGSGYLNLLSGTVNITGNLELANTSGTNTFSTDINVDNDLNVQSASAIALSGGDMYVAGNILIDGTINLGTNSLILDGGTTSISGTGSVSGTGSLSITGGDKSILAGSDLIFGSTFSIDGAYTVTNNGTITASSDITGSTSSSTWVNGANSTLNVGGALLSTGMVSSSAVGNTISYNSTAAQAIKTGSYYNLTIAGGSTKSLSGNVSIAGDLNIASATTLSAGSSTITLSGDWVDNGDFTEGTGTVVFAGTTTLTCPNTEVFNNLQVDNGASLDVPSGQMVTVLGSVTNNGTVYLRSPSSTGAVASWIDNGTVSGGGVFEVERYLPSGRGWYVASPVSNATSADFNAANTASRYLFKWNETSGWQRITNNSTSLTPGIGYAFKAYDGDVMLSFSGTVNTGTRSQSTSYSTSGPNPGWVLLSNPYPSAIDWDALSGWTKTNLRNIAYTKLDGVMATYNGDTKIGTNGGTNIIAPMQAIWVKDTIGGGQLSMTNAVRVHDVSANIKSIKSLSNILRLAVDNGSISDEAVLYFTDDASRKLENKDTEKNFGAASVPHIYSKSEEGEILAVNSMSINELSADVKIPLGIKVTIAGNYAIKASDLESFDPGKYIYLEDTQEGVTQNLREDDSYEFYSDPVDIDTRFKIQIKQNPLPVELLSFNAKYNGSVVDLSWETASEKGNDYFTVERSSNGFDYETIDVVAGAGDANIRSFYQTTDYNPLSGISYYRLKQTDFDGANSYPGIVVVEGLSNTKVSIYPNPVSSGKVYVECKSEDNIYLEIQNSIGQIVYSKVINDECNLVGIDVDDLSSGIYQVRLLSGDNVIVKKLTVE